MTMKYEYLLYFNWKESETNYLKISHLYCSCKNVVFDTFIQQNTDLGSEFNWQIWCQQWWKNDFFQSFFLTLFTYNSAIGEHEIL